MKTRIKKTGDTVVVSMDGLLDFNTFVPLREDLAKLLNANKTDSIAKKIIFDLENLEFVGSCGISSFIQTLKEFNSNAPTKPIYCNVKSEFRRIIKAFDEENLFEFNQHEERGRKRIDQ
jgi:anti-anti-sigma factor